MFLTRLYPDPILSVKTKPIAEYNEALATVADHLVKVMLESKAKGIAAPQVGVNARILSLELGKDIVTIVNPVVVDKLEEIFQTTEGCLSIPSIQAVLNCRSKQLTVTGYTVKGEKFSRTFFESEATAIQHELDHLDGITILDRMGPAQRKIKKERYLKKWKKWKKSDEGKKFYLNQTQEKLPELVYLESE